MSASILLDLGEDRACQRGVWPDPADTYPDVSVVNGDDEMMIPAVYSGSLDDSSDSREQIEVMLCRRMNFIYHGGLVARVPDAPSNGRSLAVTLLLPDDDLPPVTWQMLQEYHELIVSRGIAFRVIQVPRETL